LSLTSPAAPASGKALLRLGSNAAPMARKAVIVSAITLCMVVGPPSAMLDRPASEVRDPLQ
jgi:hypothetical protein